MATVRLFENRRVSDVGRVETSAYWRPRRVGPRFVWLDHDSIRIEDGRLAGREFGVRTSVTGKDAVVALSDPAGEAGKALVDIGDDVVLWEVGIREELRGAGLAAVLSWLALREALLSRDHAGVRFRMVRSLKSSNGHTGVQNVGMAIIAHRLGLRPDVDMARVTAPGMILRTEVIEGRDGSPPALKLVLKRDPLVLICLVLDPVTLKPLRDPRMYVELAITNGNFSLRSPGIRRFIDCVAVDADEAARLRHVIKPL
jgi:hypothetical protein